MPLSIVHNDITLLRVDAIVNAANNQLTRGGGVCGAIFSAAGESELAEACARIGYCKTGNAVATGAFRLPTKYIIHTVGPVWQGGNQGEQAMLKACYQNSLVLAKSLKLQSIAFPLISSGIFDYPREQAFSVAVSAIGSFLAEYEMNVLLVLYQEKALDARSTRYEPLNEYIRSRNVSARNDAGTDNCGSMPAPLKSGGVVASAPPCAASPRADAIPSERAETAADSAAKQAAHADLLLVTRRLFSSGLTRALEQTGETFSQRLMRLIDERNMTDPEVYQRANLDRRLFSKIRGNLAYQPSKNTALALAVALRLNLDETADLLRRAGYALSPSSRFDLIVEYFIKKGNFNVYEINEALYAFDESQLGA